MIAPDGSEIRLLSMTDRARMVHCSLPPGGISKAVSHRSVDELWYFLSGSGRVWRKFVQFEEVIDALPGLSLNIPLGTTFQFYNNGSAPLCFVIVTIPPWPGEDEAVLQPGRW